jgi:hypothetical protein
LKAFQENWNNAKAARAFLNRSRASLGIVDGSYSSWYQISPQDIIEIGGKGLLETKNFNLAEIFKFAFPEHNWNEGSFRDEKSNTKRELNRLLISHDPRNISKARATVIQSCASLGVSYGNFEEWYNISYASLEALLGQNFFRKFRSKYEFFSTVFPEYDWHPWLFKDRYGSDKQFGKETQRRFIKYLEQKLGIKNPEEWYRVTKADFERIKISYSFRNQAELLKFLHSAHPDLEWRPERLSWASIGYSKLHSTLVKIFPDTEVALWKECFPLDALETVAYRDTVLVVPRFKLIFEYQGPISYAKQILGKENAFVTRIENEELLSLAERKGLTLISIPFWWNRKETAVMAEIWRVRKDLFEEGGPLRKFSERSFVTDLIDDSIDRTSFNFRPYLRTWSRDSRFEKSLKL